MNYIDEANYDILAPNSPRTLYIEIDDFLGFLEAHKIVSGIQRVQSRVISYLIESRPSEFDRYIFVLNPSNRYRLLHIDESSLKEIIDYIATSDVDHEVLRSIITVMRSSAKTIIPDEGSTYLMLGAFWGYGGVSNRYLHLKRRNVSIIGMIYDLIPITNNEYCDAGLPHEFTLSFGDSMRIFDGFLCISDFTAQEVRKYRLEHGLPEVPVEVVPLAHNPGAEIQRSDHWSSKISAYRGRPFVLFVSTIEARKNHLYVVNAWKQFIQEGLDPPDLVFVGRPGWHVASLMEQLETAQYYGGRVSILHDLSDGELATLYRNCLFTVFPSFVEGWGLPVGESLIYGKPCVASNTSSIPEVGGDFVDYVDPLNFREGLGILRRMTFDEEYRQSRTRNIVESFVPRDWDEVACTLLAMVHKASDAITVQHPTEAMLPAGSVFEIGALALGSALPLDYGRSPRRLILENGWYGIEPHGAWMHSARGTLRFRSDLAPETPVVLYFRINSAPWATGANIVSVDVSAGSRRRNYYPSRAKGARPGSFLMRAYGEVDADGMLEIAISVTGPIPYEVPEDLRSRQLVVGLSAVAYCEVTNSEARLHIGEEFLFDA